MAALPNLFDNKGETIIPTIAWHSLLSQNQGAYDDCVVRTLTHVKNLRSRVTHEYLQVIVEKVEVEVEESKRNRTRLIAERQTEQDQVIIGRRDWRATSSSGYSTWFISRSSSGGQVGDLPLPLYSLKFDSGVLRVRDLVCILKLATDKGGKYSFLKYNCYWFARDVFESLKLKFRCIEERWRWSSWRGWPILRTASGESEANSFAKDRVTGYNYAAPEVQDALQVWFEAIYADAADLSADNEAELEETKHHLSEWISGDIGQGITLSSMLPPESGPMPGSSIGAMVEASKNILEQDTHGLYQETFRNFDMQKQVEVADHSSSGSPPPPMPSCIKVQEPTESEQNTIDRAVQVLVGDTLKRFTEESEF